jgi:hypothetical protein
MEKTIKEISREAFVPLYLVSKNGTKKMKEFHINCSELDDFNFIDIRDSEKYKEMFSELNEINGPCLYFFEITSGNLNIDIIEKIKNYSKTQNSKTIPAIKKKIPNSNILYVGKVKGNFWGRLIQHLGYYKVNRTQGLQLFYWAKEIDLSLKLTVMEFEDEMVDFMEVLERGLAKRLDPILGKHK